jgi:hypothetical protein
MLREFQASFRRGLLEGFEPADAAGAVGDRIPSEARLSVYRNNLFSSLTGVLQAAYPAVAHLVGAQAFDEVAQAYIRAVPPRKPQLWSYGDNFPSFLSGQAALEGHDTCAEVARLDWAFHLAYFAADAPALSPVALQAVPVAHYPQLRFVQHPSVRLLALRFCVFDLWQAARRGEQGAHCDTRTPRPDGEDCEYAIVSRPGHEVRVTRLGKGEFTLLIALSASATLAEAAEAASSTDPTLDLQTTLAAHLRLGTFTDFSNAA